MARISVIMPVYNGEKYLSEAIDSILNQTFSDFEFIIINDCSTDNTENIIKSYDDKRIRYIKNEKNLGVAETLNKGLDMAQGEFIARMDADDISLPNRFEKQLMFMNKHKNIGVCGTWIEFFGEREGIFKNTINSEQAKVDLLFNSCLAHPSVMIRKNILTQYDLYYNPTYEQMEDYELWCRISHIADISNIPYVLLKYRCHSKQVTQNSTPEYKEKMRNLKSQILEDYNIAFSDKELNAYIQHCCCGNVNDAEKTALLKLFEKIYILNNRKGLFNRKILRNTFQSISVKWAIDENICNQYSFINKKYMKFCRLKAVLRKVIKK